MTKGVADNFIKTTNLSETVKMSLLKQENLLQMSATALLHAVGHDYCIHVPAHVDFFRITPGRPHVHSAPNDPEWYCRRADGLVLLSRSIICYEAMLF